MLTMIEQLESYHRNHVELQTVDRLSPYNKGKPGSTEREHRRVQIYEKMADDNVWTVQQLKEVFGWETRQISSAVKVLVENGFVKIVGRTKVNNCKTCLYKRVK